MVTIYNCHSISVCILWIVCFCIKRNGFKVAILRCVRSFLGKVRTLTLPPLLRHDEITWGGGGRIANVICEVMDVRKRCLPPEI